MKIALVHDFLKEYGGGERVLETLHEMFPEAPIYTAYYDPKGLGVHNEEIRHWDIRTSWMQKIPLGRRLISPFRVCAPMTFENFDLTEYDLVISSSSTYFANAVITSPAALHLNYIHTPPRYLYGYATSYNYKKHWWTRILGELVNHFLRLYDFEIAQRPDILIANSENVAKRIKKFYRREAVVIYPPVNVEKCKIDNVKCKIKDKKYFLSVGRLVRGKGLEIIIEACGKLGLPLKIVGSGPELKNLKFKISKACDSEIFKNLKFKNIEFLGHVPDTDLPALYAGARATIVASEDEDFGIVPVESMACGTPVVAVRAGGFLETVVPGKTGEFFGGDRGQVTVDSIINALKNFDPEKYTPEDCKAQAEKFSKERFKKELLELIKQNIKKI